MRLQILHVPACPNLPLLQQRLAQALAGGPDVEVTQYLVEDQDQAAAMGMVGSPTLLVDGVDPFAESGRECHVSCRLYLDEYGRLDGAPSVSQLRAALSPPAAEEAAQ